MGWLYETTLGVLFGLGWPAVIALSTFLAYAAGGWRTGLLALSRAGRSSGPWTCGTLA
jgi:hypothetical protein